MRAAVGEVTRSSASRATVARTAAIGSGAVHCNSPRRSRLVDYLCHRNLRNPNAIDEQSRAVYARAYSRPESIRAANGWYQSFTQDIEDSRTYAKLTIPVAALHFPDHTDILDSLAERATDVLAIEIPDSGHYLAEEQPELVAAHLCDFFG